MSRDRGNAKRNFRELSKEVSSKIRKTQLVLIRVTRSLISNERVRDNESALRNIVTSDERQNWKEDQNGSTAVDRRRVWRQKSNNVIEIGLNYEH